MENLKKLKEARDNFHFLIESSNSKESAWQKLFAEYPFILSEALPLRLHPQDIVPLGRPGKSEPDFIFYPKNINPPFPYGVIEIKKPDTPILRIPRKDILTLSADATTALAQAQKFSADLKKKIITRMDELLIVGNELHLFLIVGMSNEIANKVTNSILRNQYKTLLPLGCRIIPYDTLLSLFESKFKPSIHLLHTSLPYALASLKHIVEEIEIRYSYFFGGSLYEEEIEYWEKLEKEFLLISGTYGYNEKIFDRKGFEIIGSIPDRNGKRPIATEAPNPAIFATQVSSFISNVIIVARLFEINTKLTSDTKKLFKDSGASASN